MIFGEYLFERKIRKLIKNNRSRAHQFCSLDKATDILVLYRYEDGEAIEPQLKKLAAMNKRVSCCISGTDVPPQPHSRSVVYIDRTKQADKYGIPDAVLSSIISGIHADILIDRSKSDAWKRKQKEKKTKEKVINS